MRHSPSQDVAAAYGSQARVLAQVLGTTVSPEDPDRHAIETWAASVPGSILDVGSGTGRWSGLLTAQGYTIEGLEPAEQFVRIARDTFPSAAFRHASIADLEDSDEKWAGVLAWYSLIHMGAGELAHSLATLHSVLNDEGHLLLSFFVGARHEPLAHPATTAYRWPMTEMIRILTEAGFRVTEHHTSPDRTHASVTARVRPRASQQHV